MAICDANYKFLFVAIGAQGICGDSGVFRNSTFGAAILNETLNIPHSAILPGTDINLPCFFVADEAFPLRKNIMGPCAKNNAANKEARIFNYRLSRARRMIENTFGILASRWRILRKPIIGHPRTVDSIVKAAIVLHNFVREVRGVDLFINNIVDKENHNGQIIPGPWRDEVQLQEILFQGSRNYSTEAMQIRNTLRDYLVSDAGRVAWQDNIVERNFC